MITAIIYSCYARHVVEYIDPNTKVKEFCNYAKTAYDDLDPRQKAECGFFMVGNNRLYKNDYDIKENETFKDIGFEDGYVGLNYRLTGGSYVK